MPGNRPSFALGGYFIIANKNIPGIARGALRISMKVARTDRSSSTHYAKFIKTELQERLQQLSLLLSLSISLSLSSSHISPEVIDGARSILYVKLALTLPAAFLNLACELPGTSWPYTEWFVAHYDKLHVRCGRASRLGSKRLTRLRSPIALTRAISLHLNARMLPVCRLLWTVWTVEFPLVITSTKICIGHVVNFMSLFIESAEL